MKRFLLWVAAAIALVLSPGVAVATPVSILTAKVGNTASSWTSPAASSGCSAGAAVAAMETNGQTVTSFTDSTGATWTQVYADSDHAALGIFKRLVGSNPITTSTTFTVTAPFALTTVLLNVICVADGTGIPTSVDGVSGNQPGDLGTGGSLAVSALAGPSAATSYQIAVYSTWNTTASIPAAGSDASWINIVDMQDTTGASNDGMSVAYRQATSTATTALNGTAGGFTFNMAAWAEVAASGGGGGGSVARSQPMSLLGVQ